jgi:indole-3-glycerol phosphate synthase
MSLLSDIITRTRADMEARRARVPEAELKRLVADAAPIRSLKDALSHGFSIIGEIKKRSPSQGEMNPDNVEDALTVYNDSASISAISVLTDEPFFGGSLTRLQLVRAGTNKPILRKDFILDEYQVWEARAYGADAILLMGEVHENDPRRLHDLYNLAKSLGLQALVEIGMSESEAGPKKQAQLVPPTAEIMGINSRQFHSSRLKIRMRMSKILGYFGKDLTTYPHQHQKLRTLIPPGKIAVAESGIKSPKDLDSLVALDYNAALIGTAFLKGSRRIAAVVADFARHVDDLKQGSFELAPDLARRSA